MRRLKPTDTDISEELRGILEQFFTVNEKVEALAEKGITASAFMVIQVAAQQDKCIDEIFLLMDTEDAHYMEIVGRMFTSNAFLIKMRLHSKEKAKEQIDLVQKVSPN